MEKKLWKEVERLYNEKKYDSKKVESILEKIENIVYTKKAIFKIFEEV